MNEIDQKYVQRLYIGSAISIGIILYGIGMGFFDRTYLVFVPFGGVLLFLFKKRIDKINSIE